MSDDVLENVEFVSVSDVRRDIASYLKISEDKGERIAIVKHGKPIAAIVPFVDLVTLEKSDEAAFEEMASKTFPKAADLKEGVRIDQLLDVESYSKAVEEPEVENLSVGLESRLKMLEELAYGRAALEKATSVMRVSSDQLVGYVELPDVARAQSTIIAGQIFAELEAAELFDPASIRDNLMEIVSKTVRNTLAQSSSSSLAVLLHTRS